MIRIIGRRNGQPSDVDGQLLAEYEPDGGYDEELEESFAVIRTADEEHPPLRFSTAAEAGYLITRLKWDRAQQRLATPLMDFFNVDIEREGGNGTDRE